jgi:16S rRNA (guanine527-N7)-methyltransferase
VREALEAGLAELGVQLERGVPERLLLFRELVAASPIGLTGLKEASDQLRELVLDSLAAAPDLPEGLVVDLGTGAGVPGIPLALARPDTRWWLIESNQRKAGFVRSVLEPLGLTGRVEVLSDRAETLAHDPARRGRAQACVAKALAPLAVLVELGLPFLDRGGTLIAFKGPAGPSEEEASSRALSELHGVLEERLTYHLDGRERFLCRVRKVGPTPRTYPRRPGIPAKQPL